MVHNKLPGTHFGQLFHKRLVRTMEGPQFNGPRFPHRVVQNVIPPFVFAVDDYQGIVFSTHRASSQPTTQAQRPGPSILHSRATAEGGRDAPIATATARRIRCSAWSG